MVVFGSAPRMSKEGKRGGVVAPICLLNTHEVHLLSPWSSHMRLVILFLDLVRIPAEYRITGTSTFKGPAQQNLTNAMALRALEFEWTKPQSKSDLQCTMLQGTFATRSDVSKSIILYQSIAVPLNSDTALGILYLTTRV